MILGESDDSEEEKTSSRLRINHTYARKYEAVKRRQELGSLRDKARGEGYGSEQEEDASDDSEDTDEDEDGEGLTPALEFKILQTINSIRSRNPKIYQKDVTWFNEEEQEEAAAAAAAKHGNDKKSREQRKTYKDVVREQVLLTAASNGEALEESSSEEGDEDGKRPRLVYDAEQEDIRRAFLEATNDDDDNLGGAQDRNEFESSGLLRLRERGKDSKADARLEKDIMHEVQKMVANGDGKERDADAYLKHFILGRKWVDLHDDENEDGDAEAGAEGQDRGHNGEGHDQVLSSFDQGRLPKMLKVDDEEDAREVDRMEDFESKYNFRFEQEEGGKIISYGRNIQGSARRKDDKRKQEREAYKQRKAEERKRKEEELRRLKNLKKEELRARLEKIRETSGGGLIDEKVLEEEYDPETWDKQMTMVFGDSYYQQEETDQNWRPDCEGMEDDFHEGGNGARPTEQVDGDKDYGYDNAECDEEAIAAFVPNESSAKAMENKLLEELYELDYEDMIDDIPCRFKYKQVEGNDYGLTTEEILTADDADLNRFVSLKKLNPYREDEYYPKSKQRHRFRESLKKRQREQRELEQETTKETGKKTRSILPPSNHISDDNNKKRKRQKRGAKQKDKAQEGEVQPKEGKKSASSRKEKTAVSANRLSSYGI